MNDRKRPPTAAQLNKINREQWEKWNAQIANFERKHPERAGRAAERAARLLQQGHISNPELAKETSYTGIIVENVELLASEQSIRAKKKGRVRKDSACRRGVIAAMRAWRLDNGSFADFLEAAKNATVTGISINVVASRTKNEYRVDCDEADDEITVSLATLRNWYTSAGKSTPA